MWQKLKSIFKSPLPALVSKNNVIILTAYPKKGILTVSHKGQVRRALFRDNTMRNMVSRKDFEKNAIEFFSVAAQLLDQVIKK